MTIPSHKESTASDGTHVTTSNLDEFIIEEDKDGDLYIPFNERFVTSPTNDVETLMHLIKGALCSGILAIPLGFKYAGLVQGLAIIIFIGFLITYCIYMLITCAHILCIRVKVPAMLYPDVCQQAFETGPKGLRKYSKFARETANVLLVADLFLSACVSVVFIGTTVEQIVENYEPAFNFSPRVYMAFMLVPLLLMNMIGKLKYMAPLSMLANLLMLVSIVIVLVFITDNLPHISERVKFGAVLDLPAFIAAIIFAIQCIGVTLSLENNMKYPQHMLSFPGIVYIGMFTIVSLNLMVGFFGYWKFGDDVEGNVILNLPVNSKFAQLVRFCTSIAICFTHSLQLFVPIQVISHKLHQRFPGGDCCIYIWVRVFFVTLSVAFSIAVPNFFALAGFIGSISLCALGFGFPAIIQTLVFYENPGYGALKWRLLKNIIIIILAIVFAVSGTIVSVKMIFDSSITIH